MKPGNGRKSCASLVIEDEAQLRAQVQSQLQAAGYTVDVSGDGKDGLFSRSEYPLDAAIIDLAARYVRHRSHPRLRAMGKNCRS